jgi:hypothetical protein
VDGDLLSGHPPYKADIQLIGGMVPVNLVNFIKVVGFDYGMSLRDVAEGVLAGHQILWHKELLMDTAGH